MDETKDGAKVWYIPDGTIPLKKETKNAGFEGHEAIIVLNCNNIDAEILMDIYFEEKEPINDIKLKVPARRVRCFRMDHPDEIGGVKIERLHQYALRLKSNVEVVIQFGKMDISQPNLSYYGTMAYSK